MSEYRSSASERRFDRKKFVGVAAGAAATPAAVSLARSGVARASGRPSPELEEATIAQLQAAMAAGRLTSLSLVQAYKDRIRTLDKLVNAVIELNPDAESIARQLDAERRAGHVRGPLHGIPVMLKANIDTGDRMQTTAGSLALVGRPALQDSTVAANLRKAGAVILGKTNLSEWANFRGSPSTSGWSGVGGLTNNPYVLDRNACGSSSGSGAATSAAFCAAGLGTETDGSIVCPANENGVVGIKPTVGLTSRAGVVPISHSQDTVGPHGRTVADAAAMLTAIQQTTADPRDAATRNRAFVDYTRFVDPNGLRGARIGVPRHGIWDTGAIPAVVQTVFDAALQAIADAGATIVDPADIPTIDEINTGPEEITVLIYEFKRDLNAYLATRRGVPIRTLADAIAFNDAHADQELKWFDQSLFEFAESDPFTQAEYEAALAAERANVGPLGIDAALAKDNLDALVLPTDTPAWTSDLVLGDHFEFGTSSAAAQAGYPLLVVPMGNSHGLPMGMTFSGTAFSEAKLIRLASGFEAATRARITPQFVPTLETDGPAQRDDGGDRKLQRHLEPRVLPRTRPLHVRL